MDEFTRQLTEIHARNMLANDYQKTLALLRALKAGTISIERINLTADGWQIVDVKVVDADPVIKGEKLPDWDGECAPAEIKEFGHD